ncbi:MAG TPA: OB-fold nucleic acid binding domain-containing protein, partial [Terracidiphilus sp.]|nr:OB-fold nucleic acid binding domain-containing protein [Terracidiphilus sp.]
MKDLFIADLAGFEEGRGFDGFFLLLASQQRTTRAGKPYLSLTLADKTGQLEGRVWDPADARIAHDLVRGDLVKARGSVSRFDDRLQMKVEQLRKAAAGEADRADMLPATALNVDELWQTLLGYVEGFTEPHLKQLLHTILGDAALA